MPNRSPGATLLPRNHLCLVLSARGLGGRLPRRAGSGWWLQPGEGWRRPSRGRPRTLLQLRQTSNSSSPRLRCSQPSETSAPCALFFFFFCFSYLQKAPFISLQQKAPADAFHLFAWPCGDVQASRAEAEQALEASQANATGRQAAQASALAAALAGRAAAEAHAETAARTLAEAQAEARVRAEVSHEAIQAARAEAAAASEAQAEMHLKLAASEAALAEVTSRTHVSCFLGSLLECTVQKAISHADTSFLMFALQSQAARLRAEEGAAVAAEEATQRAQAAAAARAAEIEDTWRKRFDN